MGEPAIKQKPVISRFFEVRLQSVVTDVPLGFDLFLLVSGNPILFRKQKDVLTNQRLQSLLSHGGQRFLVLEEQRPLYIQSLKEMVNNPETSMEVKSRYIKESAFLHVNDLFEKESVAETVKGAEILVSEMVDFVSEDVSAVANLMQLSKHDYYTYNHCVDVAVYTISLAKQLYGADREKLIQAGLGGLLHDIGKRKIDTALINKQTKLSQEEWLEIKKHPEYGQAILIDVENVPQDSKRAVYEHHENYDGTGYPNKKRGDEVCELSRIVAIADVFDALTTERSYHKAISPSEALDMMFGMQPGKFDPDLFEAFNKKFDKKANLKLLSDFDHCQAGSITRIEKK
jgi:putative nucleotidyltransferase with HDIG domain